MSTKVFWSEPTPFGEESLRRYSRGDAGCPNSYKQLGCHDASVYLGEGAYPLTPDGRDHGWGLDDVPHDDPRWPKKCEKCDYVFTEDDNWQHNLERKYASVADPTIRFTLRKPIPGAMFNARWLNELPNYTGADGISLMVILPNGHEWHVDGVASNCTKPQDRAHKCWVRHGDPRTGTIHVDKSGVTCDAGAGSILAGDYHGFLHHGVLT